MMRSLIASVALLALTGEAALAHVTWKSGGSCRDVGAFAGWRGTPLGLATGWAPHGTWNEMLNYMSSSNPRALRSNSANVSIGLGLFPKAGGNLADCAANKYATDHRSIGSRLVANGVGDAEIRLGWEANNASFVWTAVGKPAAQWKACFTNAAKALKAGGPNLRISWHMAKKGKLDVDTIWPQDAPITNVGVSHYEDEYARLGTETADGSPWGLRAWLAFAKGKGRKLQMAEWGVGRVGDNPAYIQAMHDFFHFAGADLAHEAYFNCGGVTRVHPVGPVPRSSERYRSQF